MMRLLTLFLFLSVASLAQDSAEQEVIQLSRKKFEWMVNKKLDSLGYLMDERIQYVHSNGWSQNKTEVVEDIRSGKLIYEKIEVAEADVRVFDRTAIVIGRGKFSVVMTGTALTFELGFTEVYVKQQSGWKLISRHGNRMP